jgi:RHH-type proline utilization regulon transcriptional repressor/proline dehydrogenase/delta 1-pyrroline-5-carboxylate dehydrogenase
MIFEEPPAARWFARDAIDASYRADESATVKALLAELELPGESLTRIEAGARRLVQAVREAGAGSGGLDAFLYEYGLSTQEGVMLMCVAEALLRVPDDETQERLIRDKITAADWDRHLGRSASLFVNASTWALMLTGRVIGMHDYQGQSPGAAMRRLVARIGEPVVRESVTQAMRILGRQFVMGRTIEDAIERARDLEDRGYAYSYDMLGEAARTMEDAERYFDAYRGAIAAIGAAAKGKGVVRGPGISVKLSALHARYEVAQAKRVMDELVPRLKALAKDAAAADIGLTIDAEEADRLDLSLDVIEAISGDPELSGWDGFGVVVQAYQKRAPHVLDWLGEIAEAHKRRLMLRLVKGAYWDSEIKRAQELGLADYPVFTRKASTDVSYLACARRLVAQPKAFYPQFASHNAHTIAAVLEFAGEARDFEFQRLHGMGESLYEQVIEKDELGVGCRIYAPVGQHEDLLAYLVRRLLENGANSSFVNRVQDESLPIAEIIADPIATVRGHAHLPHPRIPLPRDLYRPQRENSKGIDLSDRTGLARLAEGMTFSAARRWAAKPWLGKVPARRNPRQAFSPADRTRMIGLVTETLPEEVPIAVAAAAAAAGDWAATPVEVRAGCLDRMADLMEKKMPELMALCVREAGKTLPDAVAEVREAVDFCRYYAARARSDFERPRLLPVPAERGRRVELRGGGVFACISPWNFPLAIFSGQVAAALAAGNAVIAKPAEQTPLVAALAVRLFHRAGIPKAVLHLLPGDGATIGGPLVADSRVSGVCFTGSTEVAQLINRTLAGRETAIAPLIAETGGQNAMIVDSTALPEQVTRDVIASAFQSAGQRCSALRVLFLQEDVADKMVTMLAGAMEELVVSDPALLSTDIGPVIDEDAEAMLEGHVKRMLSEGRLLKRTKLGPRTAEGCFVAPAAFEIDRLSRLQREVFGPILHVIRFSADRLEKVIEEVNATGYGLTLGVHSRIDETWQLIHARARVGNTYVNRNQIGAIVGVQPFGGQGLSGTGPKAGGPHYLHRFAAECPAEGAPDGQALAANGESSPGDIRLDRAGMSEALTAAAEGLWPWAFRPAAERAAILEAAAGRFETDGESLARHETVDPDALARAADYLHFYAAQIRAEFSNPTALPGPTGERNEISLHPRGLIACIAAGDAPGFAAFAGQIAAALAAGNTVVARHPDAEVAREAVALFHAAGVPAEALHALAPGSDAGLEALLAAPGLAGVALAGPLVLATAINRQLAAREGLICPLIPHLEDARAGCAIGQPPSGSPHYLHRFTYERTLSIDTTASGGNASLLSLGAEPGS